MAFLQREISSQDGQLLALYEFRWGATFWRYTNADTDQTVTQGDEQVVYAAIAITDDGVKQGGSANNDLKVDVQNDIPLVELFRSTPPSESIWLTVRRRHAADPDDSWLVHWIGTVGNVKKGSIAKASIIGRTLLATFRRSGLRLSWTRSCPHMLYDSECRVDPEEFAVLAEITGINADGSITVDSVGSLPQGYFDGGFIEWVASAEGTKDTRGIESSISPTSFMLFGSRDRLAVGMEVALYPGCDLTAATCSAKFNNIANYGGFEQMTGDNPFDGKNIF